MKNKLTKVIFSTLLIIACSFSLAMPIFADGTNPCVVDNADLLTDSQEENLANQAQEMIQKHNTDIVIVTSSDMQDESPQAYADDFFDYNDYGVGDNDSGVLIAVDMTNRKVAISVHGEAMEHIDDDRATDIRETITPLLTNGDYENAFSTFITEVDTKFNSSKIKGYAYDEATDSLVKKNGISLLQVLLFAGISIVAGLIACFAVKAKYQLKFPTYNYPIDERTTMNVTENQDIYIRENTTSYRIESSNNNDDDGGSHKSSSGSGHTGSSGSF